MYHCKDCKYSSIEEYPEECINICQITGDILEFDVNIKTPCKDFHPEEYIRALNTDSVTRD